MDACKYGKWQILLALLLCITTVKAQYAVTGGEKAPVLAFDNTNYRTQVFLVYGMNGVTISYTSQSASHKWYRYKTKVDDLNPEPVLSTQNGTTSTISNVEDGYGYYVDENGAMRRYVWIIDYGKYAFDIRNLNVSTTADPCSAIRLEGDADMPDMIYNVPTGLPVKLEREFEVAFETLLWNSSTRRFDAEKYVNDKVKSPFSTSFPPPLTDSEITLKGDKFAEYFGIGKTAKTPFYQTKAIEIHADTTILNMGKSGAAESGESLSAPVEIDFRAYANVPVAALFNWKIFLGEDENPIVNYSYDGFVYTFALAGKYRVTLEVSDRTGICYNDENQFEINITETEMVIPNAFSPGTTPGINDIFRVKYRSVIKFQGWIFNRWGNQLFHWTDPSQGWDGMYNGKYVPADAYYYVIEYQGADGKNHVRKGDINVFRGRNIDLEPKKDDGDVR